MRKSTFSNRSFGRCALPMLLVCFFAGAAAAGESQTSCCARIIDVHAHVFRMAPEAVIQAMDQAGIHFAVFIPVPNSSRSRRRAGSEELYLQLSKSFPDRVAAFYGGNEINAELREMAARSPSDDQRQRFSEQLERTLLQGYKGIGELAPRHIGWNPGQQEIDYPADHALMLAIADLATKLAIPMDVHLEATDKSIPHFERLLAHNPKTRIVWEHAGWSNTGLGTPDLIRRLMSKFPNLYSAIKYVNPDNLKPQAVKFVDGRRQLALGWKALFEDFPDRFMIGTDAKLGDTDKSFPHVGTYREILAQLSPVTAVKIGSENARRVLGLPAGQ